MGRHIVTVARQFGCGGGEIAKKLAELLSVEYFDKELLEKAAEASGISKDAFERADERAAQQLPVLAGDVQLQRTPFRRWASTT